MIATAAGRNYVQRLAQDIIDAHPESEASLMDLYSAGLAALEKHQPEPGAVLLRSARTSIIVACHKALHIKPEMVEIQIRDWPSYIPSRNEGPDREEDEDWESLYEHVLEHEEES